MAKTKPSTKKRRPRPDAEDAAEPETPTRRSKVVKIEVKANATGYYHLKLHKAGDTFTYHLKPHEEVLPHWVNAIDPQYQHLESEDPHAGGVPPVPPEPSKVESRTTQQIIDEEDAIDEDAESEDEESEDEDEDVI